MKQIALFVLFFCTFLAKTPAQTLVFAAQKKIDWSVGRVISPSGRSTEVPTFPDAVFMADAPMIPSFSVNFPVAENGRLSVEITDQNWVVFEKKITEFDDQISDKINIKTFVGQGRGAWSGSVNFMPIRKNGGRFERLESFRIAIKMTAEPLPFSPRGNFATTSILADGDIFKFGVNASGVYKLTADYLTNTLKINNLSSIDPRTIKLFGNGGGMLPEANSAPRVDDLVENAIYISGESDGKFDGSDYILFYAAGPNRWVLNEASADVQFNVVKNLYDTESYYFLKINAGNGLRITDRASLSSTVYATDSYDDFRWMEDDKLNLLDYSSSAQGSGRRWYGDQFKVDRDQDYSAFFSFKNLVTSELGRARMLFSARSGSNCASKLEVADKKWSANISGVNTSYNEAPFAAEALAGGKFTVTDGFKTMVNFPQTAGESEGFLDYIAMQVRRNLTPEGAQMEFRDLKSKVQISTTFSINAPSATTEIWDISNPISPIRQATQADGAGQKFGAETFTQLRSFINFDKNTGFLLPNSAEGKVENQNIHALDNLDLAIIFHPDFEASATALRDHRISYSGYSATAISIKKIFNEFSSGATDPTAIRDFARMLYERNPLKFKYLCLFGDGSFDYKNIRGDASPSGFIPVWETLQSFDPINSFPSDDYFAMLDPNEGATITSGLLDIGVGRLTARTADEAADIFQKIKDYDTNPATLGDWRLRMMFLADDEDLNLHINQADTLANQIEKEHRIINPEKIYLDAYQQVSTAGDPRFPDATNAINAGIFKGALAVQWIGHGGPRGWAQERVLSNSDIESWDNPYHFPLLITATCSFGGFDDPTLTTGGEQILLKKNGGGIGLFTTTRAVYILPNNYLTSALADTIFGQNNGKNQALGLILNRAKNAVGTDENGRRFTLLGDPSMVLAVPENRIIINEINGKSTQNAQNDTLRSLQPVVLKGEIQDVNGQLLANFNGKISITFFDKKTKVKTLVNDPGDSYEKTFTVRRNIIFKGKASVKDGRWSVSFVIPKDINYAFGKGKISLYAEDGTPIDAAGTYENVFVGGTFANGIVDEQPPKVDVFMNNEDFAFGGLTDADPKIYARISDDFGINVTGAGIGHDLTAIIDEKSANPLIINDFYESVVDDATRGKAIYPLSKLAVGRHSVRVKAWDVANNSGEGMTEFVVASSAAGALDHVLNYPNPFTTSTNFQFEHNMAGEQIRAQVQIFSVSGKLVKTLSADLTPEGYRVSNLAWDGLDDYGDQLARGVYVYKIRVETAASGQKRKAESGFERLVIIK